MIRGPNLAVGDQTATPDVAEAAPAPTDLRLG